MNELRRDHDLPLLAVNLRLIRAAQAHAAELLAGDASGHIGKNGSEPMDRVGRDRSPFLGGRGFIGVGENIALNNPSPRGVVEAWLQSEAHRAVLLHPGYREVGIGFLPSASGPVWVADFGSTGKDPEESPERCHPWPGSTGGQ